MNKLKKGFYTALGTPLDKNGNIIKESLVKEIEQQIAADASGLLLMGSMGAQAGIKNSAYVDAVKIASEAVKGRVPLFVGVMDNSIARVCDRIDAIKDFNFDAVVCTTPYYETAENDGENLTFFKAVADHSPKPLFLYDLAVVTKQKINYAMVCELAKHKNIVGIKSGDIVLGRLITNNLPDFEFLFSGLDIFDVALSYGIDKVLDGMLSATPKTTSKFIHAAWDGNKEECKKNLDKIVGLRDLYCAHGIFNAFTHSMNLIGCEGMFGFDWETFSDDGKAEVTKMMKEMGEI